MAKLKKHQLAIGSFHYAFYPFEHFVESMRHFGVTNVEISGNRGHLWVSGDGVERAREMTGLLHDAGIGIYATFVFGYDNDDERTVADALEFAKKHNFYTAAFNHLLPFPNTALYHRLRAENRLIYDKWWLEDGYHYGELSFHPKKISAEKLSQLCRDARKEFSAPATVLRRGFAALGRTSPLLWGLFWGVNLRIGGEVDQKMHVPIGENLDELPK